MKKESNKPPEIQIIPITDTCQQLKKFSISQLLPQLLQSYEEVRGGSSSSYNDWLISRLHKNRNS